MNTMKDEGMTRAIMQSSTLFLCDSRKDCYKVAAASKE